MGKELVEIAKAAAELLAEGLKLFFIQRHGFKTLFNAKVAKTQRAQRY
jgi:hypothetical protein